jgi:hypothetical protein
MKTSKKPGIVVKSNVKAGIGGYNHNRSLIKKSGIVVKSNVKAGIGGYNHSRSVLG